MDRPLKWWVCGWYIIKDFKYWYWVQDDYGDAVLVSRNQLGMFHSVWRISPVGV